MTTCLPFATCSICQSPDKWTGDRALDRGVTFEVRQNQVRVSTLVAELSDTDALPKVLALQLAALLQILSEQPK